MTTSVLDRGNTAAEDPAPGDVSAGTSATNRRSRGDWARQFFSAGVFSYVWACVCNGTLNVLQTGGDFARLVTYDLLDTPALFLLSSLVVWLVLLLLIASTGRLFISCALLLSASAIAGFANYEKLRVRNEPILPSDLGFAGEADFLRDMVPTSTLVVMGAFVALVLVVAVLLGRLTRSIYPRVTRRAFPSTWRRWLAARIGMGLAAVMLLGYVGQFNANGNVARLAYDRAGAQWAFWYQKVNYLRHGPVAGFLYNMSAVAMHEPPEYSRSRMEEVADRYERLAARMNRGADAALLRDLNVVVVLSESFSDPTEITGVSLERDPIPFTRGVMRSTVSGELLTQHFGGGTANMEFEALTGQSLSQFTPQHDTPYSMSVYEQPDYPSLVGHLRGLGHRATGIHPYMPTMYKREQAYDALGFDRFVTEDDIAKPTRIDRSEFIADSTAFDETLAQMRATKGPDLLNIVTMQNHYPTDDSYDDPMPVSGVHDDAVPGLSHFARGLEHSDTALQSFLAALEADGEPTAVIFYGDHQPALWQEDPRISGDDEAMHRAPFFLWSDIKDFEHRDVPLTSPVFFAPMLFEELGAKLPPFYALLLELQKRASAMERGNYYDEAGDVLDDPRSDPKLKRLLDDYRLVQYDFSVGERYAASRMFPQKP